MKTTQLSDHLYVVEAAPGVGNVVFLSGPDGVLLVDSMFPQLHDKLIAAIRATGATGPIRYVINTHLHNDHTAGNTLMAKDLSLYLGAVESQGAPSVIGPVTAALWERFADDEPGADFTRIYPFVEGS